MTEREIIEEIASKLGISVEELDKPFDCPDYSMAKEGFKGPVEKSSWVGPIVSSDDQNTDDRDS